MKGNFVINYNKGTEIDGIAISKAMVYRLRIPLTMTFAISLGSQDYYEATIVEISVGSEKGYGEAETVPQITGETPEVLFDVASGVISSIDGHKFKSLEDFSIFIDTFCYGNNAAKSSVEMAMHDALAKNYGIDISSILGGSTKPRMTSLTIPIGEVKDNLALLEKYQKMGCKVIKVKVGKDVAKDIERLNAISSNLPDGVVMFADANQGYKLNQAVKVAEVLYRNDALFFEQPMHRHDLSGISDLRKKAGIPIMLDESISSPRDVIEAVHAGAVDMVNIKLSKSGGIRNATKVLITAQALGLEAMVGCMLESKLGIAASLAVANAVDNVKYTDLDGFTYLSQQPFEGGIDFRDGTDYPVKGRGLAVTRVNGVGELP